MPYLRYLCLFGIVVSNTNCVVLYFPPACVPHVASFSGLSIVDCPSVFSNEYLVYDNCNTIFYCSEVMKLQLSESLIQLYLVSSKQNEHEQLVLISYCVRACIIKATMSDNQYKYIHEVIL